MTQRLRAYDTDTDRLTVPVQLWDAAGAPVAGKAGLTARFAVGAGALNAMTNTLVALDDTLGAYNLTFTATEAQTFVPGRMVRVVIDDGATLPFDQSWPCDTNEYADQGTAQAGGTANIIVLRSGAPSTDLSGCTVEAYGGTGAPFTRDIDAYNTTTKQASFKVPVGTAPDATTKYVVYRNAATEDVVSNFFSALVASYSGVVGSFGEKWGKLALDSNGHVTVGSFATAALTALVSAIQASGTYLSDLVSRITAGVGTKLGNLAVDGSGQVTTGTVASGVTAAIKSALEAPGGALATINSRVTGPVALNADMAALLARVPGTVALYADLNASTSAILSDIDNLPSLISAPTATSVATAVRAELATELGRIDVSASTLPAAMVAALKGDAEWRRIRAAVSGKFTYTPPAGGAGTGTLAYYDADGTTLLFTQTVTIDASRNVGARSA